MQEDPQKPAGVKEALHPRNKHRSRYDLDMLSKTSPELAPFVVINKYKDKTINFADPQAVKALNSALLKHYYNIASWDIPDGYLSPPVPGRADYIHHAADLLGGDNGGHVPTGPSISVLDIGVGANCIFPIIGSHEYQWKFIGTDTDAKAIQSAKLITASNPTLENAVEFRFQSIPTQVFKDIVQPGEEFDLTVCNPPFHSNLEEARMSTERKWKNLDSGKLTRNVPEVRNFGGQPNELSFPGGEEAFISHMIAQSAEIPLNCYWFTTLVSKGENMHNVYKALKKVKATEVKKIDMAQGNKVSRLVAWTFLSPAQKTEWRARHWWNS